MKKFVPLILLIFLSPLNVFALGNLYIVGGGKQPNSLIKKFIQLCGEDNKILVVAKASSYESEVRDETIEWLLSLGAKNVYPYICEDSSTDCATNFKNINCIYFSGGDQNKLTQHFFGRGLVNQIHSIYQNGGTIGGTSAGAAIQSQLMLTGHTVTPNSNFNSIAQNNVQTTKGFGFLTDFVIDQHFIKRQRQNRLLSVVLSHPDLVGLGIDESTAVVFEGSNRNFTVYGQGSVVVYDSRHSKNISTDTNNNFNVKNMKLHLLTSGMTFLYE